MLQTITGLDQWYIGCNSWHLQTQQAERHFFRRVTDKYSLDYLQELFANGLPTEEVASEVCGVIESTKSRLKNCGRFSITITSLSSY